MSKIVLICAFCKADFRPQVPGSIPFETWILKVNNPYSGLKGKLTVHVCNWCKEYFRNIANIQHSYGKASFWREQHSLNLKI